jgi:hypothetical protein
MHPNINPINEFDPMLADWLKNPHATKKKRKKVCLPAKKSSALPRMYTTLLKGSG